MKFSVKHCSTVAQSSDLLTFKYHRKITPGSLPMYDTVCIHVWELQTCPNSVSPTHLSAAWWRDVSPFLLVVFTSNPPSISLLTLAMSPLLVAAIKPWAIFQLRCPKKSWRKTKTNKSFSFFFFLSWAMMTEWSKLIVELLSEGLISSTEHFMHIYQWNLWHELTAERRKFHEIQSHNRYA